MDWIALAVHLQPRVLGVVRISRTLELIARLAAADGGQDEGDDGRIGSGRDDSNSSGTLVTVNPANNKKSASLSALGSTFIPVAIFSAICFAVFFVFRRKCRRVYAPRTVPSLRTPE